MIPSRVRLLPQIAFCLSLFALLLLFALTVAAQSGRRSTTGSPSVAAPTPSPDAKSESTTADPNKKEQRQDIILTSNRGDSFAGIPLYFYDIVLKSCASRLDDAREVKVEVVQKHTSRSAAINSARDQKTAYVVWLQLRTDGVNNNTGSSDYGDVSIDFTVYEPTTAKAKVQGTVYQGAYRNKGVIVGPKTTGSNSVAAENRLRDAARDAADRIIRGLHLVLPTDMPTH